MLSIEQLDWSLGQKNVFKNLNLSLMSGEHIVIVGGSGSGKSTLLKLVADNKHANIQLANDTQSAMVMQQGALLDHLNVIENLRLVQRYHGKADNNELSKQLLALNIDTSLHKSPINQLSGGQLRRVAIARALLTKPQVMLFDEPDAGLDIANLQALAEVVNELTAEQQKGCITVSHNPYYIARIATKVYRLENGALHKLVEWFDPVQNEQGYEQRQQQLQALLNEEQTAHADGVKEKPRSIWQRDWVFLKWLYHSFQTILSLCHWPKSFIEASKILSYSLYLSFFTGLLFFGLVGAMLGCTTIAVVKLLSDNALTGLLGMLIKPITLLEMMGGAYVLYLAPAIGGMLFVARSGSMMSNWLGEMTRSNQVNALRYLSVPVKQYLMAPSAIAIFISSCLVIVWFALFVWLGSVFAAEYLFKAENPMQVMSINQQDVVSSLFWLKVGIYSLLISLTVVALGLAPKFTAHQVNIYTTKAIIYATLSIALVELLIVLT